MKLSNLTVVAALAAGSLTFAATAGPVTLAHWTFEESVPATSGPYAAELGLFASSSFASGFHADETAVYSNPVGNGSMESYSSNRWSIGDYYQFTTSTEGYESLTIQWDQTRSSTGPGTFMLQWSTDGVNFNDLLEYDIAAITWSGTTYNEESTFGAISLPAALNDLAVIYIRLTNLVEPGGTAGSNRVDDIIIGGTLIPAPGALALLGVAGLVGARRRRNG